MYCVTKQSQSIHVQYKNLVIGNRYHQPLKIIISLVNTQLANGVNYIYNIDNIIFSNVSISNSLQTGLVLVNSKLTINGSFIVI